MMRKGRGGDPDLLLYGADHHTGRVSSQQELHDTESRLCADSGKHIRITGDLVGALANGHGSIILELWDDTRQIPQAVLICPTLYAMTGGLILQWLLGYNFSVAVWVGFIALFGIAVETGVVMVVYLHQALDHRLARGVPLKHEDIEEAAIEGGVQRLRPKLMTVCAVLVPILWESGIGSDVMKPIATPIVGGDGHLNDPRADPRQGARATARDPAARTSGRTPDVNFAEKRRRIASRTIQALVASSRPVSTRAERCSTLPWPKCLALMASPEMGHCSKACPWALQPRPFRW